MRVISIFLYSLSITNGFTFHSSTPSRSSSQSRSARVGPLYAGFGSSSGAATSNNTKLKAKKQWDRFLSLKKSTSIPVAVRVEGEEDWLEVGNVRSKDDSHTVDALRLQRSLVAEVRTSSVLCCEKLISYQHARRLYPGKISAKSKLHWAVKEDETWSALDASSSAMEKGLDKSVGFEGISDPSTGFYCNYKEGRIVGNQSQN